VQARPFFSGVRTWRAVRKVVELQRIALDIVQLILGLAASHPKVNRVGPVAFANRADVASWNIGGKKKQVVERENRMISDARRWILHYGHNAFAEGVGLRVRNAREIENSRQKIEVVVERLGLSRLWKKSR